MSTENINITLVLTGGRAGQTCRLGKHEFVDGKCRITDQSRVVGSVLRYMARCHEAFPEGSPELAQHQERDNGKAHADQSPGSGLAESVPSNLQPDGTSDETATDGTGTDDSGNAATEHGAEGNGHEYSRIREAMTELDHENDEHWTQGGKPAVHVVSEMLNGSVSRADIDAAAPDFRREGG